MEYKIFHGPNTVHFVECDPNSSSVTESGQPNEEVFTDEGESIARVIELDEDFFPVWDRDSSYNIGARVKFGTCIFRALQTNSFTDFQIPDIDSDSYGEIPTPMNRQARWLMVCDPEFEAEQTQSSSY